MDPTPFSLAPTGVTNLPCPTGASPLLGRLSIPEDGHLVLRFASPRPVKIWIGRHLAVDDTPERDRTHIFRQLHLAVMLPLEKGEHAVRIEFGDRSRHIDFVEKDCPSRGREETLAALLRLFPDALVLTAVFTPGGRGPAVCLRFERGQFRKDGMVWQDTWIRPIAGFDAFPARLKSWAEKPVDPTPILTTDAAEAPMHRVAAWPDRPSTDRRAYVPVWGPGVEPPLAREIGVEDRPESVPMPVAHRELTVRDLRGEARVAMPVFESVGRWAPKKNWSEVEGPVFEKVWAVVPKPILPASWEGMGDLYVAAWKMLCRLWQPLPLESGLPNGYLRTSEQGFENLQFQWDTCFTTLAVAYGARAFPVYASLDCLYARQEDGGHLERECDTRDNRSVLFEPGFGPNPPIIPVAEWAIARLTGETARLAAVLPALEAQFQWLLHHRRLPDGTFWTTGLANGLDNSPSLGEGYPCLTGQMAHFAELLGRFHATLGNDSAAVKYDAWHREIGEALNRELWSDDLGCYSTSLSSGGHNPNKVVTTFWPLWAGVVPPDRIAALARLARDPACFNRHHPLPSLSADSPVFRPGGDYWRGSVWAPTNHAALQGFWRAGEKALAREFTRRHLACMVDVFRATDGVLWENYSSEKSERGSWSQKNYSWTAASPIALLLEILIGLEPDAVRNTLHWHLPEEDGVGVDDYPLGKATVHLAQRVEGARRALTVRSDRAFHLVVHAAGREFPFRVVDGVNRFEVDATAPGGGRR